MLDAAVVVVAVLIMPDAAGAMATGRGKTVGEGVPNAIDELLRVPIMGFDDSARGQKVHALHLHRLQCARANLGSQKERH